MPRTSCRKPLTPAALSISFKAPTSGLVLPDFHQMLPAASSQRKARASAANLGHRSAALVRSGPGVGSDGSARDPAGRVLAESTGARGRRARESARGVRVVCAMFLVQDLSTRHRSVPRFRWAVRSRLHRAGGAEKALWELAKEPRNRWSAGGRSSDELDASGERCSAHEGLSGPRAESRGERMVRSISRLASVRAEHRFDAVLDDVREKLRR